MSTYRPEQLYSHGFFQPGALIAHQAIKRMALGLDFDGCTDKRVARAKLSDSVANFVVDHPEIDRLDVIISSLRQTFILDFWNAHNNPLDDQGRRQSCTAIDEELLKDIHWKIELLFKRNRIKRLVPTIMFHPFLLSDIYNGFPYGTTFGKMKEFDHYSRRPNNKTNVVQAKNFSNKPVFIARFNRKEHVFETDTGPSASYEFADTSKVLMIWTQLWYFSTLYGAGKPFVFRFVDDNPDIIQKVTDFFAKYPHLVPKGCSLESLYMSSNYGHYPPESQPILIVKGTGSLKEDYRWVCSNVTGVVDNAVASGENAHDAIQKALLYFCPIPMEQNDSDEEIVRELSGMKAKGLDPIQLSPESVVGIGF